MMAARQHVNAIHGENGKGLQEGGGDSMKEYTKDHWAQQSGQTQQHPEKSHRREHLGRHLQKEV